MNGGIISTILTIIFIILLYTGWFDGFIERAKGLPSKNIIFAYATIAFVFTFISIETPIIGWQISIGGYIIPLLLYFGLWHKIKPEEKIQLFTSTMLMAAIYFLVMELIRLDPVLLIWDEKILVSLLISLLSIIVAYRLKHRYMLFIGGLIIGEFLFHLHHRHYNYDVFLGNGRFRDLLWIIGIEITVLHISIAFLAERLKGKIPLKKIRKIRS